MANTPHITIGAEHPEWGGGLAKQHAIYNSGLPFMKNKRKNDRVTPTGSGYEKNAAFAGVFARAMDSWWAKNATDDSRYKSMEAVGLLLRYGHALTERQFDLPEKYEVRSVEVDDAEAQAAFEVARELADEAVAVTGTPAVTQFGAPIVREFGYLQGHAELFALWQLSTVFCRYYLADQRYAGFRQTMEDMAALFDVDSAIDITDCLEGMICYLGFAYPEIDEPLSIAFAEEVDAAYLEHGPIHMVADHTQPMYYRIRCRAGKVNAASERAALGAWTLSHRMQWDLTETIQGYSLAILADIDACCRELGIDYFLAEGALLGAMRHHGFIPWDDDIDVGMLRADYDRFVKEAPAYFDDKYAIDTYETNPKHWTISGKVQMTEETDYISLKAEGLALSNGPFVDIFAFDETPVCEGDELVKRGRRISALRALLYHRTGFQKRPSVRKAMRKKVLSQFTPVDYLHKEIDQRCREYQGQDCPYVANFGSLYKVEKETFPVEDIKPVRRVDYEGLQVNVPNNAEAVLDKIYGNWHELPPYESRIGKHRFIKREDYEAEMRKHVEGE